MRPIRLLIVDDHALVRQGLRAIIRVTPDLELVGEADGGRAAVELAAAEQPDVVLVDLVMPELDGVGAIAQIKRDCPATRIIALTTFSEADLVLGAVQAGADGYLLKDVDVQELARAIRIVHIGKPYLHPEATRHLLQATVRPEHHLERLTAREPSVLTLDARGLTNRQIADTLASARRPSASTSATCWAGLGWPAALKPRCMRRASAWFPPPSWASDSQDGTVREVWWGQRPTIPP